jgi:hypothetical protein
MQWARGVRIWAVMSLVLGSGVFVLASPSSTAAALTRATATTYTKAPTLERRRPHRSESRPARRAIPFMALHQVLRIISTWRR